MRQRRVRWSIGNGCGHAIAVAVVFLVATGGRGESLVAALPCAALVAAVAFVVGSGAAYLAATLRARR
jgi:hypothetical protein